MLRPICTPTVFVTSQIRSFSHPGLSRLCTFLHPVELMEAYAAFVPLPTVLLHRGCDTTLESFLVSPFSYWLNQLGNRHVSTSPYSFESLETITASLALLIVDQHEAANADCCGANIDFVLPAIAMSPVSGRFPHLRLGLIS